METFKRKDSSFPLPPFPLFLVGKILFRRNLLSLLILIELGTVLIVCWWLNLFPMRTRLVVLSFLLKTKQLVGIANAAVRVPAVVRRGLCRASSSVGPGSQHALRVDTPDDMEALGAVCAKDTEPGDVVCLTGDLGAGKTCFARGFVRSRLGDPRLRVTSPTYLLDQSYEGMKPNNAGVFEIHHMDLYRLSGDGDLSALNIETVLRDAICLFEWPERLGALMPSNRLDVDIRIEDPEIDRRMVTIVGHGEKWKRMAGNALLAFEEKDSGGDEPIF